MPPLARDAWDRAAEERGTPGLVDALRADEATLVLVVHGDRAPVEGGGLRLVAPGAVAADVAWAFLGRSPDGRGVLLAAAAADAAPPIDPPSVGAADPAAADASAPVGSPPGAPRWAGLREAGADLSAADAGLFVEGLSLARWLLDAPHCSFCGHRCEVRQAGWSRRCPHCGREHFPRTDPAVIVAVTDAAGERLLLGAARAWGGDRYSCFAGFVEAGESLEATARRELLEEAGVEVSAMRYHASQAWPYPRSLMLGFHAVAGGEARPDGDEIVAVRWFTRDEVADALAGRGPVGLPGRASIAHSLIEAWLEGRS